MQGAAGALYAALDEFDRLLAEGDIPGARAGVRAAMRDPALATSKGALLAAAEVAGLLEVRRARIRARAEAKVGQEVRIFTISGARKGRLREVTAAGLVLVSKSIINGRVMGTREVVVPWKDLTPSEEDRLARDWSPEGAAGQVALAALAIMRGDDRAAEQALVMAGESPLVPHYRARLVAMSAAAADRVAAAEWKKIEASAGRELTAASARTLIRHIEAFETAYGRTGFAAGAAGRIDALRGRAAAALGPVEGLVAHWSFDNVAGRAARDSTGRHHATVVGAKSAPGKTGKALAFDGKASYVELPAAATKGLKTFSFSFWVNTTEARTSATYWQRPCILGQATKGVPSGDMSVSTAGGLIAIFHGQHVEDRRYCSTTTKIGDGKWHHVAVTRDASAVRLTVDARFETSLESLGPALNETAFRVGAQGGREEAGFHTTGVVDDVRLYNRALTAPEICALAGLDPAELAPDFRPGAATIVGFPKAKARFVRLMIRRSYMGAPGVDEFEVYGPGGGRNLALAGGGAKPSASSCIAGYAIHKIPNLNDGLYGNPHSWIAAGATDEWAQIELPRVETVSNVVFSRDRTGVSKDRMPIHVEVQLSLDGKRWKTVREAKRAPAPGGE
jgi:hypothetical protein